MGDLLHFREDSNPQLWLIRRHGWPVTKAAYVRAMFSPYDPTFPLDAEIAAAVPDWLPGELPTSVMDTVFETPSTPNGPAHILPALRRPPNGVRQLDPALVDSVLEAHPHLTREEAIEELLKAGA